MGIWPKKKPRDEDGGTDGVGQNPTGNERKSSAGQRRKKDRKTFEGTKWGQKKRGKK